MSRRLDWSDPAAVRQWFTDVRVNLADAEGVVQDMLAPPDQRKLGPVTHRHHYEEARASIEQLLAYGEPVEESAAPQEPLPLRPCVLVNEQQAGDGWHRWINLRFLRGKTIYGYTAEATALTFEAGVDADAAIYSPWFAPCVTNDQPPEDVLRSAIEACQAVALRLRAFGVDRRAVTLAWPAGWPSFKDIVTARAALPREVAS